MSKIKSMYLNQNTFDIYTMKHGSGYEAIHVQIKEYGIPKTDKDTILISRDAISPEDFDNHIDELIGLLNESRSKGYKELKNISNRENSK